MSIDNLFEKASRRGFRYVSSKGLLTTEDLWTLPLIGRGACLNDIAIALDDQIDRKEKKNFVDDEPTVNQDLIDMLEIVKHIIAYKKTMAKRAEKSAATKARNQRIMEIIANKQDAALQDKSIDELKALMEQSEADI